VTGYELFHTIASPPDARVRREVVTLGLKSKVAFRNVHFDEHRARLAALGGTRTPALWDGARLHEGEGPALAALRDMGPAE
jgi:hypothetical protein